MPAPTNTWTTSYNNVPTQTTLALQGSSTLLGLKNAMVAAGYVIQISSNGTTLQTNGTDTWSTTADVNFNTAGSAHSYVVMETPNGMLPSSNRVRCLIDCGVGAANPHLVNLGFATANYTSSGSVNTIPTAPTNSVAFNSKQYLHSTLVNGKYHFQYVTGSAVSPLEVGNFAFQCSEDGTGRFQFFYGVFISRGYESADPWPVSCFAAFSESSVGATTTGIISSSSHGAAVGFDATIATGSGCVNPNNNSIDVMTQFGATGSSITGQYFDFPFVLADFTSGKLTIRGYVVDVAWAPTAVNTLSGTVEPATGGTNSTIIGGLWLPNGGVTPLL